MGSDLYMKKGNLIYGYYNLKDKKIVYVGQTTDLKTRHKAHMEYDPCTKSKREYNYPLSRGIRKHGQDNYKLKTLEIDVPKEKLLLRERYWIKYYDTYHNGYNQTQGGETSSWNKYDLAVIEKVKRLLLEQKTFAEIKELTGISFPHISNINMGYRCYDERLDKLYPLKRTYCGGKLTDEVAREILSFKDKGYTQQETADKFGVTQTIVSRIWRGKRKHI